MTATLIIYGILIFLLILNNIADDSLEKISRLENDLNGQYSFGNKQSSGLLYEFSKFKDLSQKEMKKQKELLNEIIDDYYGNKK